MDIFSHGLWAAAGYKATNDFSLEPKGKKPLKVWWGAFWGIFPDLFAFAIPFVWIFGNLIVGKFKVSDLPGPETMEPLVSNKLNGVLELSKSLYNFSHSFFIFAIVFGIVYFVFKRPIWELFGWLFHIVIDIPTHLYQFFPTPFLWPVSKFEVNGFSWGNKWFLIVDFSLLILTWGFLLLRKKKNKIN